MTDHAAALAALRREAEASQRRYLQVLGEISAKRAQLEEVMTQLRDLGCASVEEAEQAAAQLEEKVSQRLAEIRQLIA